MNFEWDKQKNQVNIKRPQAMNENNTNKHTKTNLDIFDAMTDDMIDTSDVPPLTEKFFSTAKWRS